MAYFCSRNNLKFLTIMNKLYTLIIAFIALLGSGSVSAQDVTTGLVRLKSGRTSWYLASSKSGSPSTAVNKASDLAQVWILEADGAGYTLRSANTAEYLQTTMTTTAIGKATLYIRKSPNATATKALFNVSAKSDTSGDFLNTNADQHKLFKYSMDAGCDWYIEKAESFTEDQVKQHFAELTGYASQLTDGKYYRLISYYGRVMSDAMQLGGDITTRDADPDNLAQYWQLHADGSGWRLQNVLTQRFLQRQTQTSHPYNTTTQERIDQFNLNVTFNIKAVESKWDYKWTIAAGNDAAGLHDASTQGHNVVLWSTNADASVWSFQEAELSQEVIDQARAGQMAFTDLVANKAAIQASLDNLFDDKACTTLKAGIQALTDDALAANADFAALPEALKAMVLKVKNDTWQQFTNGDYTAGYEKMFRIYDYKIYSNHQDMAWATGMGYAYGKLSGPTGIVANPGDIIYIYADANAKTGSVLQLEAVGTDGVPGDRRTGEVTTLRQGLNLFQFSEQKMLYIFHQLTSTSAKLANFPDIKVHIEGGQLNGYWDATRGMTNADWKNLQKNLLNSCPVINLKTEHLVFAMNAALVKKCEPNEMEGLMRIWEQIPVNEDRYMGLDEFDGRLRNIWNVFSIDYNYMFATTYGTYYNESTLSQIMNYNAMRQFGSLWGPSHEMGHNRQAAINVIGTTESSNNTFSNINTFEQGVGTMRCQWPVDIFNDLAKQKPWLGRDIWGTTRMFAQLYLYFHVQHHDDNFFPNLFKKMRANPIDKGTWNASATFQYVEDGQTKTGTGANIASGAKDYLHLAKMICDVAKADLSEFFEAYGMFEPVSKYHVGDYNNYIVTTTQSQINSAKTYMQRYVKKLGNIMFIDDHVLPHEPIIDNIFEGKPQNSRFRTQNTQQLVATASLKTKNGFEYVGDGGDYALFTADATPSTDDYYVLTNGKKTIEFKGTNWAGHKFYDADGNLIFATNEKKVTLPKRVTDLGIDNVTVVTANYDMTDTPCTDTKPGSEVAIRDITTDAAAARGDVYDVTGRRVSDMKRAGLYIVGGKKVLVK